VALEAVVSAVVAVLPEAAEVASAAEVVSEEPLWAHPKVLLKSELSLTFAKMI